MLQSKHSCSKWASQHSRINFSGLATDLLSVHPVFRLYLVSTWAFSVSILTLHHLLMQPSFPLARESSGGCWYME
eukprot:g72985.t1